jgi:hypothetical protein
MQNIQATDGYLLRASQETNKFTLWTKRKTSIVKLCVTHSYNLNWKTSYPIPYGQYEIGIDVFEGHEQNLTAIDANVSSIDHASDVIHSDVLDYLKLNLAMSHVPSIMLTQQKSTEVMSMC